MRTLTLALAALVLTAAPAFAQLEPAAAAIRQPLERRWWVS